MVTSVYGKFLFVVVDMRKKSKNYLKHKKWILNHQNPRTILVLTILCKCSSLFVKNLYFSLQMELQGINILTRIIKKAIAGMILSLR